MFMHAASLILPRSAAFPSHLNNLLINLGPVFSPQIKLTLISDYVISD